MFKKLINNLIRYPSSIRMRFRIVYLKMIGAKIGRKCWIQKISIPRNPWNIEIASGVSLDREVVLLVSGDSADKQPKIVIGERAYINRFAMLDASEKIQIGRDCMIGPYTYITDHDHGMKKGEKISSQPLISTPVVIGIDVWIGAHVSILKGVKIGDGAIIGAGSVVTSDVPPHAIFAGVPAKQIRDRK